MKLFGKKEEKGSCCCGGNCTPNEMQNAEQVKKEDGIKILGSGCAKCVALEKAVHSATKELGQEVTIEHITDYAMIASYGIMTTPALVVNGKVVSYGKVLSVEEVKELIIKQV